LPKPAADPPAESYNARRLKKINATGSLVRFENKSLFHFEKNVQAYYNAGVVVVNLGANPTTLCYNASVVKIYNATGSLVRFENKSLFHFEKHALSYYNAG
jgi:hypothetical protein